MSKIAIRRFGVLLTVLILAMATLKAATGQTQHSPVFHAPRKLAQAADTAVRAGVSARIPPHLSTLLGLTKEQECPVKQSVLRTGSTVQGIDVSDANKEDIVLFVVDESANNQNLYLTSPEGTLRKVVAVKAGVGDVVRITDADKRAFQKEKQFWVDRLVPSQTK